LLKSQGRALQGEKYATSTGTKIQGSRPTVGQQLPVPNSKSRHFPSQKEKEKENKRLVRKHNDVENHPARVKGE
jgi:hypothetical protein